MIDNAEGARRLLDRAIEGRERTTDFMIIAAASAALEAARPTEGRERAALLPESGVRFVAAVAAETRAAAPDREHLRRFGVALPPVQRAGILAAAECLLARLDPDWAWSLIVELAGESTVMAHGSLGLDSAAKIDRAGDRSVAASGPWVKAAADPDGPFGRQLRADGLARAAVRGALDIVAPELAPLRESPPGGWLLPTEAASYLLAAAAIDPPWALAVADGLLLTHRPDDMIEAMRLTGRAAAHAGHGAALVERSAREDFVTVQTAWIETASFAGVLTGRPLVDAVDRLAERAKDELDVGDDAIVKRALLGALAFGGATESCFARARAWRLPTPMLVNHLFYAQQAEAAAGIGEASALADLTEGDEADWAEGFDDDVDWWTNTRPSIATRTQACRDVLSLAATPPWTPLPGSLEDIVRWPF